MCLSNIYEYKLSVKIQPFIIKLLPLGYMFQLSPAIIRPYKEQVQGYLSNRALWDPIAYKRWCNYYNTL